jgi:hypothetical protein
LRRCDLDPADCVADHVAPLLDARRRANGQWSARCPAHGTDARRSLSLTAGTRQRIVWECHKGCTPGDVRTAMLDLGISAGCITWRPDAERTPKPSRDADTLAELQKLLGDQPHPVEFMIRAAALLWDVDERTAAKRAGISQATYYRHRRPK